MGSDRARISYDEQRQYRAVIMQQGRVTVEADWNEEWQIVNEEIRKDVLDIVGPCGTPDDGYRIVPAEQSSPPPYPYDFSVTKGTMYVGGLRAHLSQNVLYSEQSDWIDNSPFTNSSSPIALPEREFIYLSLREQEVSAVEDTVLREVALGGPDTAQRLRLVQHINRTEIQALDCETALEKVVQHWASCGYTFVPRNMRLMPSGTLEVGFQNVVTTPDPCEPQSTGSYLGADNQLLRVQISQADATKNNYSLLWGYDNASFLYQITAVDGSNTTFKLAPLPIDDLHMPRQGQTVEILRSAVKLDADSQKSTNYMASPTGFVTTVTLYDPTSGQVTLKDALSEEFTNTTETPVLFLRVWEEELSFTLGTPVDLGNANSNTVTGLQVTIEVDKGETLGVGTYWQIAVRPDTPTEVYPHRYLEGPQPPDGPRIWVCPLGVIEWDDRGNLNLLADCRKPFPPPAPPALHVLATNWVNDDVFPLQQFTQEGLTITFDGAPETNPPEAVTTISSATMIVTIEIPLNSITQPDAVNASIISPELSLIVPGSVTINANQAQWSITSDEESGIERVITSFLGRQQQALRVRVTLKGHTIWSRQENPPRRLYLDGQAFGIPDERSDGSPRTALLFPTGAGERASDFESWFYLSFGGVAPTLISLTLDPTTVLALSNPTSTGTVTLSGPAPSSGELINLMSDDPQLVNVPVSVTVMEGQTTATFQASALSNPPNVGSVVVGISASLAGMTKRATLTVQGQIG